MSEINLLQQLILISPYLKMDDHNVVSVVCSKVPIADDPGLINEYLRFQVDAEAGVVYLTGKYLNIVTLLESRLDDIKSEVRLGLGDRSDAGFKLTASDKQDQLSLEPKYAELREQLLGFRSLVVLLERLSMVVFRRQSKLEQLSVNYRREVEADKRSQFD